MIRRQQSTTAAESSANTLQVGRFILNAASREVAVGQERCDLTTLEFDLLWNLADNAGAVMSRERLAELMGYGADAFEGRAIDTVVARLRHRLGQPHSGQIRTIRGKGYMLSNNSIFA